MIELTSGQRAYLRKQAHDLRALVQIGKNGLTPNILATIDDVLLAHELIKIKFLAFADEMNDLTQTIAEETNCGIVGTIGNTLIVYRPHPEVDSRKITLPRAAKQNAA